MRTYKPRCAGATTMAIVLTCLALLPACASRPLLLPGPAIAYDVGSGDDIVARHAPVIVPQDARQPYDRVGRARAHRDARGDERIYIDPDTPVYYVTQTEFTSTRGMRYTNLLYRVHFESVPYSVWPFHLTAGRNGGLLIVVTLDERQQPVLITTVHTCGCYLAFVPTAHLAAEALPDQWPLMTQRVYGERLPARLDYPAPLADDARIVIFLRSGTHRVMDIRWLPRAQVASGFHTASVAVEPLDALKRLPAGDTTTSFYETAGARRGYVRDSHKPLEFLLMSWWALDPRVGVDKEFGSATDTGTVFYTSLKPWRRDASDMAQFARFLDYWGWRL